MWVGRNLGYHSFYEWDPERLRRWPRTTPLAGLAGGISRLELLGTWFHIQWYLQHVLLPPVYIQTKHGFRFLRRSHLWTNMRLNPLTWLFVFAVSQLLLALPSGQNSFRKENQAQQACSLSYCSVGCFSQRKEAKWNKSQKGPNCYIIDIRELPRKKKKVPV